MLAGKGAFAGAAGAVTPGDFVAEVAAAKDGVQEAFDPGVGGGVGVQVEAAGGFEEAVTFQQPYAKPGKESAHRRPPDGIGSLDNLAGGRALGGEGVEVGGGDIGGPSPAVGKAAAGGRAVGVGLEVFALVKGRVGGNQIDRGAVQAAEEGQIVAAKQGAVGCVEFGHRGRRPLRIGVRPGFYGGYYIP